ncbi:MAG: acetate--CoA ligase family protein [Nitrososphaerota archaeon]
MKNKILVGIEALDFLEREGFPVLKSKLVKTENEAVSCAKEIGFPVVLKISCEKVIHKTDMGGVIIGAVNEEAVRKGFNDLLKRFSSVIGDRESDGIIVQEYGIGFELIIGVYKDQQFGPVIMLGSGGIYAEDISDVTFRLLPIKIKDAELMIQDLTASKILFSTRRRINVNILKKFLVKVSNFVSKKPLIIEMDLNPIFVSREIRICDARLRFGDIQSNNLWF